MVFSVQNNFIINLSGLERIYDIQTFPVADIFMLGIHVFSAKRMFDNTAEVRTTSLIACIRETLLQILS